MPVFLEARRGKPQRLTSAERLCAIAAIIEAVDERCMAADGPVTPTRYEITDDELRRIYELAAPSEAAEGSK